ncbi:hypothetical protein SDC9_98180 [bioreactor metagenome]|uniref:Uncharacterized protein n=1 Tax=bioreactor metagenome TaxID=1076179 RepID=A0A645AGL3_9ZZZZ
MAGAGIDLHRAAHVHQCLGSAAEGAAGVHHVVKEDDPLALDVADDVHNLGGVCLLPALVHNGQTHTQLLGKGAGAGHRAHVGGDDNGVVLVVLKALIYIFGENGVSQQVVHRDVKKALNLGGVQVHGQHPVGAGPGDEVGHQLGRDGVAGLCFAVLPGVAEVGHNGGDPAGRGPLQGVDHDEHFHQIVVDRAAGGLNDEYVGAAHRFINGDKIFAVGKSAHLGVAQRQPKLLTDTLRQLPVGITGENFDVLAVCDHADNIPLVFCCMAFPCAYPPAGGYALFFLVLALGGPLGLHGLRRPGDGQAVVGYIVRNGGACGYVGAAAHPNRRDEVCVAAHEGPVAHHGAELGRAVVIDRHRAAAQIHVFADVRVSHIGQMRDLGAVADDGVLQLHKVPHLGVLPHGAAGTNVSKGTHLGVAADGALAALGGVNHGLVAYHAVLKHGVGADFAAGADNRSPAQDGAGQQKGAGRNGHPGVRVNRIRVQHENAPGRQPGPLGAQTGCGRLLELLRRIVQRKDRLEALRPRAVALAPGLKRLIEGDALCQGLRQSGRVDAENPGGHARRQRRGRSKARGGLGGEQNRRCNDRGAALQLGQKAREQFGRVLGVAGDKQGVRREAGRGLILAAAHHQKAAHARPPESLGEPYGAGGHRKRPGEQGGAASHVPGEENNGT